MGRLEARWTSQTLMCSLNPLKAVLVRVTIGKGCDWSLKMWKSMANVKVTTMWIPGGKQKGAWFAENVQIRHRLCNRGLNTDRMRLNFWFSDLKTINHWPVDLYSFVSLNLIYDPRYESNPYVHFFFNSCAFNQRRRRWRLRAEKERFGSITTQLCNLQFWTLPFVVSSASQKSLWSKPEVSPLNDPSSFLVQTDKSRSKTPT